METWCGSNVSGEQEKIEQRIISLRKQASEARAAEDQAMKLVQDMEAREREHAAGQVAVKVSDEVLLDEAEESFQREQAKMAAEQDRRKAEEASAKAAEEAQRRNAAIEAKLMPLKEKATGVSFEPKLGDGLYLVGVGVRKKAIINVYAVAAYSSTLAIEALAAFPRGKQKQEAQSALCNVARTFGAGTRTTSFVLEMVFKAVSLFCNVHVLLPVSEVAELF